MLRSFDQPLDLWIGWEKIGQEISRCECKNMMVSSNLGSVGGHMDAITWSPLWICSFAKSLNPSWDMLASPKPDRDAAMNEYHLFWKCRFNTLQQLLCVSEKKSIPGFDGWSSLIKSFNSLGLAIWNWGLYIYIYIYIYVPSGYLT